MPEVQSIAATWGACGGEPDAKKFFNGCETTLSSNDSSFPSSQRSGLATAAAQLSLKCRAIGSYNFITPDTAKKSWLFNMGDFSWTDSCLAPSLTGFMMTSYDSFSTRLRSKSISTALRHWPLLSGLQLHVASWLKMIL